MTLRPTRLGLRPVPWGDKPSFLRSALFISQALVVLGASIYLVLYIAIALARISYPFELEWMEGGSVVHVQRVLEGKPLYVAPSLAFAPFIYPPLYYYVSAAVARITGIGFLPLRLVSFLSSLGCVALIFLIVHRRTSSPYASFLACALFAATFRLSGSWFDLARVDSLFLLFLLAGIYSFLSPRTFARSFLSAAFLALAFLTKQPALVVAGALSITALLTRKGLERVYFPLTFCVLVSVSVIIADMLTAGWFKYYVLDVPRSHATLYHLFLPFWIYDITRPLGIALCLCAIAFLGTGLVRDSKPEMIIDDVFVLGSLFVASYLPRIHSGGYENVLMPLHAGISIYCGIGLTWTRRALEGKDKIKPVLVMAIAIQFANLAYSPRDQLPTARDREQGVKLLRLISSFDGEVYLADHPWYLGELKRPPQGHEVALREVLKASGSGELGRGLEREMAKAVADQRYDAFILDFQQFLLRPTDFDTHYKLVRSDLAGVEFHPVTGWDRTPTYLYVRRTGPKAKSESREAPR